MAKEKRCCTCRRPIFTRATRCAECHTTYEREWRKTGRKPRGDAEKFKDRARAMARDAVKVGKLIQQPCSKCGDPKTQKHHEDYARPLDVVWLCRRCHLGLHYPVTSNRLTWRPEMPSKLDLWLRKNFMTSQMFAEAVASELNINISKRTVESWRQGRSSPRFRVLPGIIKVTKGNLKARDFVREP